MSKLSMLPLVIIALSMASLIASFFIPSHGDLVFRCSFSGFIFAMALSVITGKVEENRKQREMCAWAD